MPADTPSDNELSRLIEKDSSLSAAVAKLVSSPTLSDNHDSTGQKSYVPVTPTTFQKPHTWRSKKNFDAKVILKLLPDLDLARMIMVSSILSPKDMQEQSLTYLAGDDVFTSALKTSLIGRIGLYFDQTYKIAPELSKILSDCLFEKGSYPVAVLPENAIDEIINGQQVSTESLKRLSEQLTVKIGERTVFRPIGILGKVSSDETSSVSLESFYGAQTVQYSETDHFIHIVDSAGKVTYDKHVVVTDNIAALRLPVLKEKLAEKRTRTAMESFSGKRVTDRAIDSAIGIRRPSTKADIYVGFKTQHELKRSSVGAPLLMHFPTESVIPIHVPNKPEEHVGYFVLLDMDGYPISAKNIGGDSLAGSVSQKSQMSGMLQTVGVSYGLQMSPDDTDGSNRLRAELYANMVIRDLTARIRNGAYSQNAEIADNQEVYRVMLARSMAGQYSQMLYIPKEYMSYIAFDYDEYGIGKSLLDDLGVICTLRIITMFANMMTNIKNSIGRTNVKINFDPKDPDPSKTFEQVRHDIVRSRYLNLPDSHDPSDIMSFLSSAGYDFHVSEHPRLSKLDFEITEVNGSRSTIDTTFTDDLRKLSNMGLYMSPETIDSGLGNQEFAVSIVNNNLLLAKRVVTLQNLFTPQLADYQRKILRSNTNIYDELLKIVLDNEAGWKLKVSDEHSRGLDQLTPDEYKRVIAMQMLELFLDSFTVSLPAPAADDVATQSTELDAFSSMIDKLLDEAMIPEDITNPDLIGEIGNRRNEYKAMMKSYLLRHWMAEKNIMPEVLNLTLCDENGQPNVKLFEETNAHLTALIKGILKQATAIDPVAQAANKDIAATGQDIDESTSSSSSDSSSSNEADEFGLGGDDFSLLDTEPVSDEPSDSPTSPDSANAEDDFEDPAAPSI